MSGQEYRPPVAPLPGASRELVDQYIWEAFRFYSRTFSLASRLLPRRVRLPVATLYLYCRTLDNLADEVAPRQGTTEARRQLDRARRALDTTLSGNPPRELLWERLHEVHIDFDLMPEPLFELIDGVEWDIAGRPVRTVEDLVAYSDLVAGSVGAMMLPFLVRDRSTIDGLLVPARSLGNAMQITNILRDVGEDLRRLNRVYLPDTLLQRYDVTPHDLQKIANGGYPTPDYMCLNEEVMSIAEKLYGVAEDGIGALPLRSRMGIASAARMYREILNEVRAAGYDNLHRRNVVDLKRKLRLVAHDDYSRRKQRLIGAFALQPA